MTTCAFTHDDAAGVSPYPLPPGASGRGVVATTIPSESSAQAYPPLAGDPLSSGVARLSSLVAA